MKKILFATTALVATAGFAAADVAVKGSAEIGIVGGSAMDTQFHTDVDVVFAMTGEADNGLTFGATVDLDESDAADGANPAFADDADDGGASFFVAFGGARLDMGDTDGALDAVMKEVNVAAGSINDAETGHSGWNGNSALDGTGGGDGQIARFSYTFDSFTGHVSVEQSGNGAGDPIWGVGVRYSADLAGLALGVGLGYQTQSNVADAWGISLDTTLSSGVVAALNYSEVDYAAGATQSHWGLGLGYSMNALSIGVNYGEYSDKGGVVGDDRSGFGLAVAYDLGGGLTAQMGYGSSDNNGASSDSWSLGLAMSF